MKTKNCPNSFTDADSLMYVIKTNDIYEDLKNNLHLYDTSNYPKHHPLYSTNNKKRIECFKDELNLKVATEFAKIYSLLSEEGKNKTAKGICKHVVAKNVTHENYKYCFFNSSITRDTKAEFKVENIISILFK